MTTESRVSATPADHDRRFAGADKTMRFWWTAVLLGLFLTAWLVQGATR